MNHPAGRIGKRLILRVSDVSTLDVSSLPLVCGETKVVDTLVELSSKGKGCLLVVDDLRTCVLLGTFTDGDLRRSLQREGEAALQIPVSQLMTKTPR